MRLNKFIFIPAFTARSLAQASPAAGVRASVSTVGGKEIWHMRKLRRDGQTVAATVPSCSLAVGGYAIKLTGIGPDGATEDVAG